MSESEDFKRLFDHPCFYRGTYFSAFWLPNQGIASRLGMTLKGRTTSLWRVRMKRVIREWFRQSQARSEVCDGAYSDVNIVIKIPAKPDWVFIDALSKDLVHWRS